MSEALDPRLAERNCGCPPWVSQCVHWNGKILILGLTPSDHTCCETEPEFPFTVGVTSRFVPCECDGCDSMLAIDTGEGGFYFPTEAEARTAFAERERAMLEAPR